MQGRRKGGVITPQGEHAGWRQAAAARGRATVRSSRRARAAQSPESGESGSAYGAEERGDITSPDSASTSSTAVFRGSVEKRRTAHGLWQQVDPLLVFTFALFIVSVVVRTLMSDFPKSADVMPDELRYLDLSRSLVTDGTLTIRGVASSFQKILYPIALIPAMLFPDPQTQVHVIAFLNSLYASSVVFPAYVLAKRLVSGKGARVVCLALAALLPDLCYSMTFMSECLYAPLSLWLMVLLWDALSKPGTRGLASAAAGGFVCYIVYLCKEVALAYAIAIALMLAVSVARGAWTSWKRRRDLRLGKASENGGFLARIPLFGDPLARLALFLIGFLAPFLLLKLTLFSGMLNSYNQSSLDILQSLYVDLFAFYAIGLNAVHFLLGFAFFPLVLPLVSFRRFKKDERTFLVLLLLVFVISFLTVVFTISMREDAGHVALRQHLRYVGPLLVPFAFFLVRQATEGPHPRWGATLGRGHVLTVVLTAFCVGVLLLFGTANLSQGLDSATMHLFRFICDIDLTIPAEKFASSTGGLTAISDEKEAVLAINAAVWIARGVIVAIAVVGTVLFHARGRVGRIGRKAVIVVVAAFFVASTVACTVHNRDSYGAEEAEIQEAVAVDGILEGLPESARVLIVYDDGNTAENNLVTTYIPDRRHSYRYISDKKLRESLRADGTLPESMFGGDVRNDELFSQKGESDAASAPLYVLVNNRQDLRVTSEGAITVSYEPQEHYTLYCVLGGAPLSFEYEGA
ncbi:MAG TPA: hypothetical protein IAA69_04795 [Candidatus Aveggerthella stercoripullorum]|uniref:Uncharacterized protein n=1 Tax=Candidatus Aveggerthella stercoripullorum TaxID=2840688 RepID=A0A9D1D351_9ACTN|nr:hypothetical protein [Candidatus Aveggerthella stercoripullorum]